MKSTIVLHHNDLDGRASAAIWYSVHKDSVFLEMDYKNPIPWSELEKYEFVVLLDFSIQPASDWEKLKHKNVCWIDHHISAINAAPQWVKERDGLQSMNNKCGALLTWNWLYNLHEALLPPYFIKLIDAWDRWTHNGDLNVLRFKYGMDSIDNTPKKKIWKDLLFGQNTVKSERLSELCNRGQIVMEYQTINNADILSNYGYSIILYGFPVLVCNVPKVNSQFFDSDNNHYKIHATCVHDGKVWTVSLYSKEVDVSEIAIEYGGGGHKGAAGFQCGTLPWFQK
jgi:uncharacterized protein